MVKKNGKRCSAKLKFQLILEALQREGADVEVARAYGVHPVTLSQWKKEFLEKGAEVFGSSEEVAEYEKRVGDLERNGFPCASLRSPPPVVTPSGACADRVWESPAHGQ